MYNVLRFLVVTCFSFTGLRMKSKSLQIGLLSNYTMSRMKSYNATAPQKICIMESVGPLPETDLDLIVYKDPLIPQLDPKALDKVLVDCQARLNTLGVLVFDMPAFTKCGQAYALFIRDPKELWEYNLVSVSVQNFSLSCRKGSSMLFKERPLERMATEWEPSHTQSDGPIESVGSPKIGFITLYTGNENVDIVLNAVGLTLQYYILFNFFSFGFMLILNYINEPR